MTVAILLVLLTGSISLAAALTAYIIARSSGKSAFRAICYAAATFVATFTLILLALTFVQNTSQDGHLQTRAGSVSTIPKARACPTRSMLRLTHRHDQCDCISFRVARTG